MEKAFGLTQRQPIHKANRQCRSDRKVGIDGLATGLLAGINMARMMEGEPPAIPPRETMLGALLHYVTTADPSNFQPMNANFGLLPPLSERVRDKRRKRELFAQRSLEAMQAFTEHTAAVAT